MSRKNKTLRSFLYQNQNPTVEQAWNAAWKHAQKSFHARSMQDKEKQISDLQTECERLRKLVASQIVSQSVLAGMFDVEQCLEVVKHIQK